MHIAVDADCVASGEHPLDQGWIGGGTAGDGKECHRSAGSIENVEQQWRLGVVWTVVECERKRLHSHHLPARVVLHANASRIEHNLSIMALAILDIDGTLVDTNYHHTLGWFRAFRHFDIVLPLWRIHTHLGMGGDKMVEALAGEQVEHDLGEDIRSAESKEYQQLIGEVQPMERARDLIVALRDRGHSVVLASSAKEDEVEHYVDLLRARDVVGGWTTSADVEATKPDPDLVHAALDMAGSDPGDAVMVGDTPWDVKAAAAAGVRTLTVVTGGFSEQELTDAGALAVFESVSELHDRLDETPLR